MSLHIGVLVVWISLMLHTTEAIRWLAISHDSNDAWVTKDCHKRQGFVGKQYNMCRRNLPIMKYVAEAVEMTREECMHQLQGHRWNCSSISRAPTFLADLKRGTKEAAFVYALSAAAVSYTVTHACSTGKLDSCGCGRDPKLKLKRSNWKWGGCSDNIAYGTRFSSKFTEAVEKHRMKKNRDKGTNAALMNFHNTNVGRRAVRDNMEIICKCLGVSGSCQTKICFRRLSEFRKVATHLRKKYEKTILVANKKVKSNRNKRIMKLKMGQQRYSTKDLISLVNSPKYCVKNLRKGSYGTRGRICNPKKRRGKGSCKYICCNRGYRTKTVIKKIRCECRYVWCCTVKCKTCTVSERVSRCK
ncbi:protein Wnt-4-like [Actinia tenebrosa]|uniref:Protein Wnt n=1 Tax=Actinia tenebrosa TaxID=6105 RepID=A0A6P8IMR9_ACTTE|nr:protein Wnt-4-like [Actinia tenebrosa]XP_031567668.1 protein Wnt-4-like [Actinia tenebrosa]XP_031567669.1 protein Wnt-4-like [Actinia tenebrosa]XP_031567670.1 protein Wnt-4-like [Actinia tenebrosa]XP_031567671.1 protein Wnt-4-like [Actinia tenebrosa]XP_031567673.1 protein Wnt-4-like [Actinia tenebrosa]XP_031567674.1 protein Wnt-4-like [Actinia tenebrosa]